MTDSKQLGRRRFLAFLASTALVTTLGRACGAPLDRGIGGTGAAPSADETDRGIGGTGVIGTIRKFGSIVVNDLRIAYPQDAEVRIDGRLASVSDLKLGQVVRVHASGPADGLSTRRIDVASEVVGPVERIEPKQVVVLGQTVATAGLRLPALRPGDTVAVSGLRRNDGTIAASLIELRPGAPNRVVGPVSLAGDGSARIGGLQLSGVTPDMIGKRAIVEGQLQGGRLAVTRAISESTLLPNVRTLSVESYVERRGGRLSLGSGFAVTGAQRLDLPAGRSVRAVLTTRVGANGGLALEGARINGRSYGAPLGGPGRRGGPSGGGPRGGHRFGGGPGRRGGRGPLGFGRGPRGPGEGPGGGGPFRGGPFGGGGPGGGGPGGGGPGGGGPGGGFGGGPGGGFGGGPGGRPFGGGGGGRR